MLWKVLALGPSTRYLFSVVEAETHGQARAKAAAIESILPPVRRLEVEPAATVGEPMEMRVSVLPGFELVAGTKVRIEEEGESTLVLLPPEPTMFEQMVGWLRAQPPPPPKFRPGYTIIGVALARIAIRWGSYFAVIADSSKPVWGHAKPGVSRIGDQEMARLNIEISANLERLYRAHQEDPPLLRHLIHAAQGLPGPTRTSDLVSNPAILRPLEDGPEGYAEWFARRFADLEPGLTEATPAIRRAVMSLRDRLTPAALAAYDTNPSRRITNALVLSTWRNPLEPFHEGTYQGRPLDACRFTAVELATLHRRMAAAGNGYARVFQALAEKGPAESRRLLAPMINIEGDSGKWALQEATRAVVFS